MTPILRAFLRRIIRHGTLEIETAQGARFMVGDGTGQPLALRFMDRAAPRQFIFNPALAFGELYMRGRLVVTRGSIYDVLELATSNLGLREPHAVAKALAGIRRVFRRFRQRNDENRAEHNVAYHYDLDSGLYEMFLDPDRQYSCAYFEHPDQSLEEAQLAKKRHIAAKLLIEPGHRVLDIGCGWGGLALYLAEFCRAEVTGITLSREQLNIAMARTQERGLATRIAFHLQDYRAVSERFDRIVSVGMFEHVGIGYYGAFFGKVAELLTDDGVMLLHSIGRADGPSATNPWITKYIFPGGYTPALSEVLPAIERAGLCTTDIEVLRLHYAETLRVWRERFAARREEARSRFGEQFCRMWEFYLAASEVGFRHGGLMVFQIQLARQQAAVPLTRDYIHQREAALRTEEARPTDREKDQGLAAE